MFDKLNLNLRKNEGFPTCILCIPIPEYGQSNAPLHLIFHYLCPECQMTGNINV